MPNYTGAVPRSNWAKHGEVPSLLDWNGIAGKGTTDDTSIINKALAQAARGGMVHVPKGIYVHNGGIVLPNKNITLFGDGHAFPTNWYQRVGSPVAPTPEDAGNRGSILWNAGSSYAFSPDTLVDCQLSFRDLGFFGGAGVIQVGNLNTNIDFNVEHCMAMFCTGVAFELGLDDTTANSQFFRFAKCFFYNNAWAILNHYNCDLTVLDSLFQDHTTRALEIRGANTRIVRNTFYSGGLGDEDILIFPTSDNPGSGATYNIDLVANKFGNENSTPGETRVKLRIGTNGQKTGNPTYYVLALRSRGNHYIGTAPDTGLPTACIALHSPMLACSFSDDHFYNATYAIDDGDATASDVGSNNALSNPQFVNGVTPFKAGGVSFCQADGAPYGPKIIAQPSGVAELLIENLLSLSETFGSWTAFHVTTTSGQADPFGGANAQKLSKDATAFAVVTLGFTASKTGPAIFSVWLRSGSSNLAVLTFCNSGNTVQYAQQIVGLDSTWRRYTIRAPGFTSGDARAVRIYPGNFSEAVACDIYAFGAQVSSGDETAGYSRTTGSAASTGLGLRVPLDLSAGRDFTVERYVKDSLKILHTFAQLQFLQAAGGTALRWTLNNDGTLRLQRSSDGFGSVADTPILLDAAGKLLIQVGTVHIDALTASKLVFTNGSKDLESGDLDLTAGYIANNLPVSHGGTGASTAASARSNLGVYATGQVYDMAAIDAMLASLQTQINTNGTDIGALSTSKADHGTYTDSHGDTVTI